jgi:hypothetical protein
VTQAALRVWARGDGVTLRAAAAEDFARDDVQRALRDGIERGYDGELPPAPDDTQWYLIEAAHSVVGVLASRPQFPSARAATLHALAIVIAQRGHAHGAHALFTWENRLARNGVREFYARVPRTNGRGLYFMLRCGYAPTTPRAEDGATWFRREHSSRRAPALRANGRAAAASRGGTPPSPAPP